MDDLFVVTHGTEGEHIKNFRQVLKRLDEANINLKLCKCTFAAESIEWVGYNLSQQGVAPINSKVQRISERLRPSNLEKLRSFLRAVNQFNKFIPGKIVLCIRNITKKDNEWNERRTRKRVHCSNRVIKKATTLNHFKRNCPFRKFCDASKSGLGVVLPQEETACGKQIHSDQDFLLSSNQI